MDAKRCNECGSIFPADFKECPSCQAKNFYKMNNTNNNPTSKPTLVTCSACGKQISNQASACPNCGQPTGVHVCPKCGSADTKVISGASKAVSVGLWGVFAANKVMAKYVCNKCSHKF